MLTVFGPAGSRARRFAKRLATVTSAVGLAVLAFGSQRAEAFTYPYYFTAKDLSLDTPVPVVSGTFYINYQDGLGTRDTDVVAATARLFQIDLTINGYTYRADNTGLLYRASDNRFSVGGTVSGVSGIDTDSNDFLLTFALGPTIGTSPIARTFTFSVATGEAFSADQLVVTPVPAALPLFASALGVGAIMWRRRSKSTSSNAVVAA